MTNVEKQQDNASWSGVGMEHRLAAILHADVKGYSRLIGEDEVATLRILTPYLDMMNTLVRQHGGQAVGSRGDSLLAEFPSVVEAVQCAVEMQCELRVRNAELPADRRVEFRMGINLGEIVVEGDQLHGDGINIAVRLEGLAEAGGIYISEIVHEQVRNRLPLRYEYVGEQALKNIEKPVRVWRVVMNEAAAPAANRSVLRQAQHERKSTPVTLSLSKSDRQSWLSPTHLSRTTLVVVGLFIVGGIGTLLYPSFFPSALRTQEAPALPLPDKPSIVVLPFVNMSGDPEQEYFSDGMTDTLITDLSKIPSLFVIARNSAFTYKGKAIKIEEVSRELGVQYVLEGSAQKAGDRLRINAQLIDATTRAHLWAERYDRNLQDIFALQDELTQRIMLALKVKLTKEEQERFRRMPTDNLEAYDYYLRGFEYYLHYAPEANVRARQMFERAVELDPKYAGAYASLSATYWVESQLNQDPQALERAFELTQKAIALDDSLSAAHVLLGDIYLWKKQYEQAIAQVERAIVLDPNFAFGYSDLGYILTFVGRPQEAFGLVEKAMRLDPHYPAVWLSAALGHAYRLTGQYQEAIATQKRALARNPNMLAAHLELAVIYSELDREEEAQAEMAEILRLSPNFSLEGMRRMSPYKDPQPCWSALLPPCARQD